MGKTKELFIQMAQGFMEGINIERELRGRMADEEYRYALYKKKEEFNPDNEKHMEIVRETQQAMKENSYGEDE
tara:strand:- start:2109 stop:2327 length:219 start_codon:yes stop_codon:yes gene_type:complete